ncbi:MAG: chromosomal replication initiator protein DnaA [Clostridia bacterium]|nr:chromosomal replication initiator protein DnaA [Clostridia bacterium]
MMDVKEIWSRACARLESEMNPVVFKALIANNLTAMELDGDTLVMRVTMENMRDQLLTMHHARITEAVSHAAGRRMTVEVLTAAELRERAQHHARAAFSAADEDGSLESASIALNPKYTFDTFVVGSSNQFVHAACLAVADNPATAFNPLFIYGGVGLGKTHLMHAIGQFILAKDPGKRILYITGEYFTNELIRAIQNNRTIQFRNRFRNADVLMVDDIQFIAGKESTQEEFFHTFNTLHTAGKQIILTSDRPPHEIARLEERLRSRFGGGLLADVKKPDVETRIAILRRKAENEGIEVEDGVLENIATHIDTNIRELEGSLTRLVAYANLTQKPLTVQLVGEALRDLFVTQARKEVTPQLIMQTVADYYSINMQDLVSHSRRREITVPRQIAMYLTREMTNLSLPQIGQVFGNRDHTTVLHGCEKIAGQMKERDSGMERVVGDIRNLIAEGK